MTMSNQQHSRLGQILINKGLISAAQLDAAIQAQLSNHRRLGAQATTSAVGMPHFSKRLR
ncbi:hypothetical protein ACLBV0_19175, partial [Pseudomonas aeruginosa]